MLLLGGNGCLIESESLFQAKESRYFKVRLPEPEFFWQFKVTLNTTPGTRRLIFSNFHQSIT